MNHPLTTSTGDRQRPLAATAADRALFFAAAGFNWVVALGLGLGGSAPWEVLGVPAPQPLILVHLFLAMVAVFGFGYSWVGLEPAGKQPLIVLSIVGKLSVFAVVVAHYLAGTVPLTLALLASGDLVFAALFLRYLFASV